MPYVITVAEVKDGFSTSASDADITAYIAFADQADECMTLNSVSDAIGKQLKILFVRHIVTSGRDGGSIASERAVSGASRSFGEFAPGQTGYLDTLKRLDRYGCVYSLLENNAPIQLRSVGRRPQRQSTY